MFAKVEQISQSSRRVSQLCYAQVIYYKAKIHRTAAKEQNMDFSL